MCAAIVHFYRTYYLYYPVISFSSDLCAAYLDYYAALTQILRYLAAPTQLVASTTSRRHPLLLVPRHTSRDNGGAPLAPAIIGPSITPPPPSQPHLIRSVRPIHPLASHFIPLYQPAHKKPISPSEPKQNDTIQCLL